MEQTLYKNKQISVVFRLENLNVLNGGFQIAENDIHFDEKFRVYLQHQFGKSANELEVARNRDKVKLTWYLPNYDQEANNLHQQAVEQVKSKQYGDAVNSWVRAISLNPNDPDFYFNLGIAFFEIRNYTESVENLRKAIDICPIFYKAHLILGTVFLKTRKFEEAENHLKTSIALQAQHALAYLNLGAVYSILKRYDEGIEMFEKTLQFSANEVRAHFGLAKIYSFRGEVNKANEHYQQVIAINSISQLTNLAKRAMLTIPISTHTDDQNGQAVFAAGNIDQLYSQGYSAYLHLDYDKAIQLYTAYLSSKADDDFVWFSIGEAYLRTGNTLKAIESYQRAAAINPNKAIYYKELALSFDYLDKTNDVVANATKAMQLGKVDSVTLTLLGHALVELDRSSEAVEHLEHAIRLNPNNLKAKFFLSKAMMALEQHDEAVDLLQEITKASINTPLKMQAESLLGNVPAV